MLTVPKTLLAGAALSLGVIPFTADAQYFPPNQRPEMAAAVAAPHYADLAPLVLAAPLILDATIRSAVTINGPEAAGVDPGFIRLYVQADVSALIRGSQGIPPRVGYLVDLPADSRGRAPRLKKVRVLVFARPVAGRPTQLQLVAKDAQRRWTPAAEALTRRIAQETVQPNQPPEITGIANAFHVAGSLPGEGETQIFLTTKDNRPVSLDILRRPGEQPRWSVALSDVTDAAAQAPERDTLLWYRLACFLPPELPESSVNANDPSDVAKAREDYRFVLQSLGPCDTRKAY
ncbi:MAG: hypothetical protein ACTHM0_00685 [Sphingomonas sp.]